MSMAHRRLRLHRSSIATMFWFVKWTRIPTTSKILREFYKMAPTVLQTAWNFSTIALVNGFGAMLLAQQNIQNGTVHTYEFDNLGRLLHDRVTTLGSGVDGAVRRISTAYNVVGNVKSVTSYDNATVGTGTVVNEVKYEFDTNGLLRRNFKILRGRLIRQLRFTSVTLTMRPRAAISSRNACDRRTCVILTASCFTSFMARPTVATICCTVRLRFHATAAGHRRTLPTRMAALPLL